MQSKLSDCGGPGRVVAVSGGQPRAHHAASDPPLWATQDSMPESPLLCLGGSLPVKGTALPSEGGGEEGGVLHGLPCHWHTVDMRGKGASVTTACHFWPGWGMHRVYNFQSWGCCITIGPHDPLRQLITATTRHSMEGRRPGSDPGSTSFARGSTRHGAQGSSSSGHAVTSSSQGMEGMQVFDLCPYTWEASWDKRAGSLLP